MITNECRRIHANITNDLKRTFTNDNELGFSPIRQFAHDDVGSFSSMCEEALTDEFSVNNVITYRLLENNMHTFIFGQKGDNNVTYSAANLFFP